MTQEGGAAGSASLSEESLKNQTKEFKERIEKGDTLDSILPEAFALVREVAERVLGERPFDVQVIGGVVLHRGANAEMKTGEGKTLTSTMPVYLNALTGKGVHIITVNDYLALRDAEWMGPIFHFLGLGVGVIRHNESFVYDPEAKLSLSGKDHHVRRVSRREAYLQDITYGTNNEFGFDYLRDKMVDDLSQRVARGYYYAIVDEVDSILIDEARTPLIISGPAEESTEMYYQINKIVPHLRKDEHFTVDEKDRNVLLTENGIPKVEELLKIDNLYASKNVELVHHVMQALKAHELFRKDRDYVIKDGEVLIVDEFTGRLMPGRRYSDGLHQALEAKEGVKIEEENQTLASITFQNFFRLYEKLSGMTGTAETEALEFHKIYNLDVIVIPTNEKVVRVDYPDRIYRSEQEKFNAIGEEIEETHARGQPTLVGTISIEKSEKLSRLLTQRGVPHMVLNAKHHEREASIIGRAGEKGAVTIATNMAGRGTDIKLGEGVRELGGLKVIGTERHEARRIDNQLRGRGGRQGDFGASRFYLSLEDDLLRLFGSDRLKNIMTRMGMKEGEEIEHTLVTRAIESAQKKVEARNFEVRKHLLEYDDVLNNQRKVVYELRDKILLAKNPEEEVFQEFGIFVEEAIVGIAEQSGGLTENAVSGIGRWGEVVFNDELTEHLKPQMLPPKAEMLSRIILEYLTDKYNERFKGVEKEALNNMERFLLLRIMDKHWREHIFSLEQLREGIWSRAYGEKRPLTEYTLEGAVLFRNMLYQYRKEFFTLMSRIEISEGEPGFSRRRVSDNLRYQHSEVGSFDSIKGPDFSGEEAEKTSTQERRVTAPIRKPEKVGRNDPCPCGSGKKYKKCHGH